MLSPEMAEFGRIAHCTCARTRAPEVLVEPAELYLDLLKKSLTATLFEGEPDHDQASQAAFLRGFVAHYIRGTALTMLPLVRLNHLQACIMDVVSRAIPGDVIETGVWRGGATIFMRGVLKALGISDRSVWVADSFEGLPRARRARSFRWKPRRMPVPS